MLNQRFAENLRFVLESKRKKFLRINWHLEGFLGSLLKEKSLRSRISLFMIVQNRCKASPTLWLSKG